MELKVQITLLFTLFLAATTSAQEDQYSFYKEQARKDANYEQSLVVVKAEDEEDYWKDQQRYENDLKKQNSTACMVYMNEKRAAYSEHAKLCGNHCIHSDYYYQQASFYFIYNTDNQNFTEETIGSTLQVASPRNL